MWALAKLGQSLERRNQAVLSCPEVWRFPKRRHEAALRFCKTFA